MTDLDTGPAAEVAQPTEPASVHLAGFDPPPAKAKRKRKPKATATPEPAAPQQEQAAQPAEAPAPAPVPSGITPWGRQPANPFEGAQMMIGLGFSVFRLCPDGPRMSNGKPPGKEPYRSGVNEATRDFMTLAKWIGDNPNQNFGYCLGEPEPDGDLPRVGIDCDVYKPEGPADLEALGEMPPTLTIETPTGGLHFIYTHTEMVAQSDLAKTINVRSLGGYLGCPGSWIDGKQYLFRTYTKPTPAPTHIAVKFGAKKKSDGDAPDDWTSGVSGAWEKIGPALWAEIRREGEDRSAHSYFVLTSLMQLRLTDEEIEQAAYEQGACFAAKYIERGDLRDEITRVRAGWAPKNPRADDVFSEIEQAPGTEPPKAEKPADDEDHGFRWFYEAPEVHVEYLVDDALVLGGWGFLSGVTGSLKTFIVNRLALCVAAQRDFFGRKILERGGTCIIAAEAAYAVPDRLRAGVKHDFPGLERAPIVYQGSPPNLLNMEVLALFIDRLRKLSREMMKRDGVPLRLVIFDTYAKTFGFGANENEAHDSLQCHIAMELIAEKLGVAVLAVSHFGKDPKKGMRGTQGHNDNAHHHWQIQRPGELFLLKCKEAPQERPLGRFEGVLVELERDKRGKMRTSLAIRELNATAAFTEVQPDEDDPDDEADESEEAISHAESVFRGALGLALKDRGADMRQPETKKVVRAVQQAVVREVFCSMWRATTLKSAQRAFQRGRRAAKPSQIKSGRTTWLYLGGAS